MLEICIFFRNFSIFIFYFFYLYVEVKTTTPRVYQFIAFRLSYKLYKCVCIFDLKFCNIMYKIVYARAYETRINGINMCENKFSRSRSRFVLEIESFGSGVTSGFF